MNDAFLGSTRSLRRWVVGLVFSGSLLGCQSQARTAPPKAGADVAAGALKIAYSDWPGWVAWDIGVQKGWFRDAGVAVDFRFSEYVPSMEAFDARKVDAVSMSQGDALVSGSMGTPSKCILANDYSNGNDMIVAKPGIERVADLKGKSVGVETGMLSHLLVLKALESVSLSEQDVKIVDVPTVELPAALKSGRFDAIAAWQPYSGVALKELPGSTAIFTTKNVPGLIFDLLCVDPKSLAERRADWTKVVEVWFEIADFVNDPKNADEAARIMGKRLDLGADAFRPFVAGTRFLGLAGNSSAWKQTEGLDSVFGSSKLADSFYAEQKMYRGPVHRADYFDPSIVEAIAGARGTP